MTGKILNFAYAAVVIALLVVAGCVAPPKDTPVTSTYTYNPNAPAASGTTSASSYVTEVTPQYVNSENLGTGTVTPAGYHTFATPTPIPEDRSCRIYAKSQVYSYNGTAFTFNLKNPPMYINYSVSPQNITVRKAATSDYLKKQDIVYEYSTYDPQSYFIITVRNKTSGKVYLEDGFGSKYSTYLKRTLKVLYSDDMIVEIKGNKISATMNVWVKPVGNFDDPVNMTFDTCTYWDSAPRDVTAVALVTATTTATWDPGSVIEK